MSHGVEAAVCVWEQAAARLKQNNLNSYEQWFRLFVPLNLNEDQELRLGVPDDFFARWILEHYADDLEQALTNLGGTDYRYRLESGHRAPTPPTPPAPQPAAAPARKPAAERCSWSIHSFENFVVSEENRYAFLAAKSTAEKPGLYNPLYIYGVSGVGKTHLLQAVAAEARRSRLKVRYASCEELLTEFYELLTSHRSLSDFRAAVRGVDMLLVDDVHMLAGKAQIQEEFFNSFNTLYLQRKQIILTSDKEPCEIKGLEPRLVTRFESGVTTEIAPPGVEARLAILRMMSQDPSIKVKLNPELLEFLAENIASSVRRLKGAFLRLATFASMRNDGAALTIETAEELLHAQLAQEASSRVVAMDRIQQLVAEHFNLSLGDLLGKRRPKNIAEPRMVAMYLCRKLTDHSLPEIGKAFGKDHATILNAVRKVPELCARDEALRRSVAQLERQLK